MLLREQGWCSDESTCLPPMWLRINSQTSGLNLLLVPFSALRGFSPSTPALPSPQKPTFPNFNLIQISVDEISHSVEVPLYVPIIIITFPKNELWAHFGTSFFTFTPNSNHHILSKNLIEINLKLFLRYLVFALKY